MIDKSDPRKFPPKERTFNGAAVRFNKIDGEFERSGIYGFGPDGMRFDKYPSIYSVKMPGGYVPLWDITADEYFENRSWLNYRQFSLYHYIASLRNRGYHLSIEGNGKSGDAEIRGLAQIVGTWRPTLVADLDRLEDCLLIHRVRRPDFHGTPSELVVHSPFTLVELRGGYADVIIERVNGRATWTRRQRMMRRGTTAAGVAYCFQNRASEAEQFVFNFNQIREAFGDSVDRFIYFAMAFFQKNHHFLYTNKGGFQADYRSGLFKELDGWNIVHDNAARELCYKAANKFRTIYCPTEAELCA